MLEVYNYDESGVYLSKSECDLDPLELSINKEEIYLIPANSTTREIPIFDEETEFLKWENENWVIHTIPASPEPLPNVPSLEDKFLQLQADVDYLSIMTGVEL